jgi:hypothetical protein
MPPKARGLSGTLRNRGLGLQASGSIRTNLIVDKVVLVASKDCRRRMFFRRFFSHFKHEHLYTCVPYCVQRPRAR